MLFVKKLHAGNPVTFRSVLLKMTALRNRKNAKNLRSCCRSVVLQLLCKESNFICISYGQNIKNAEKRAPRAKNSLVELCPVRNIVARFGNKWSLLVILLLDENGVLRFNELSRLIPDVSSRVLSGTLRMLEADGLVDRQVYPVVPPRVEYRLTASGQSLVPLIAQLTQWALAHMEEIVSHRRRYESAHAAGAETPSGR